MIYLLLFLISSTLFYFAHKVQNKSLIFFYFFSFTAIFILSFFAGCRDNTVGTDVLFYAKKVFQTAKYSNTWNQCLNAHYDIEYFYSSLNYLSSACCESIGGVLFLVQLIQTTLVFFFFRRIFKEIPIWILMLCYCFLFYNVTLNLIRQGIAMAFIAYFSSFLFQRKFFLLLLSFLFCWFVHRSSGAVAILLICVYCTMLFDLKKQKYLIIGAVFMSILGFYLFGPLLEFVAQFDGFGKYSAYGGNSGFKSSISIVGVFTRVVFVVVVLFSFISNYTYNKYRNYLILFLILDFFSLSLGFYTYYTTRLSLYFLLLELPFVFHVLYNCSITKKTRVLLVVSLLIVCLFNWYWVNVLRGENATLPYTSEILGLYK